MIRRCKNWVNEEKMHLFGCNVLTQASLSGEYQGTHTANLNIQGSFELYKYHNWKIVKLARHILDDKIIYYEDFITSEEACSLFLQLKVLVPWQQERIRMMGKWVLQPRLTAWYGDADACYTYAGLINRPLPWLPILNDLRNRLEEEIRRPFNSVLLNCYRDGRDYMGWHSDDERSLGPDPVIASLSLGAERRFSFRPKKHIAAKQKEDVLLPEQTDVVLGSGSLLLMKEGVQVNYKHALPKALRVHDARINLTYRNIVR